MIDLLKENFSIKNRAYSIIITPDAYTKDDVKECYNKLANDKRLSLKNRQNLLDNLRKIYKSK